MRKPLPIEGLHHLSLTTRDVDRSRAFYCDLLGFEVLRRPPFDFRGAWLYAYGFQIHIIENPAYRELSETIDSRGDHVAFRVNEMEPVKERLRDAGIAFIERVNAGGVQQIFFHDPDGHQIEIARMGDPRVGYEPPDESAGI